VPLVKPLDVIRIFDGTIRPPGPKMVVCVEADAGFFFRINEKKWQTGVPLKKKDHPKFLTKDCHLECGEPLELDDYTIEEAIRDKGILGQISPALVQAICSALANEKLLSSADIGKIRIALKC